MKKVFLFTGIFFAMSIQSCVHRKEWITKSDAHDAIRGFAMSACLREGLGETHINDDASFALWNDLVIESYGPSKRDSLNTLAKQFVKSIEPVQLADYGGKKPIVRSCHEFYHSKTIDSLIQAWERERLRYTK